MKETWLTAVSMSRELKSVKNKIKTKELSSAPFKLVSFSLHLRQPLRQLRQLDLFLSLHKPQGKAGTSFRKIETILLNA